MSSFPDPLIVSKIPLSKDAWKLHEAFRFVREKETITVPAGYITDFASVPQIFWSIVPKSGEYDGAAVIHDYLYGLKGGDISPARSRAECDRIFLEGMTALKVPAWKRSVMWCAVHLYGWMFWK